MPLNPNAQKWVDALRSGKYQQAQSQLSITQTEWNEEKMKYESNGQISYCCLGVLCEVAVQEGVIPSYDKVACYPPSEVTNWVGLNTHQGKYILDGEERYLAETDNDRDRKSFTTIADIIESQPAGLFKE